MQPTGKVVGIEKAISFLLFLCRFGLGGCRCALANVARRFCTRAFIAHFALEHNSHAFLQSTGWRILDPTDPEVNSFTSAFRLDKPKAGVRIQTDDLSLSHCSPPHNRQIRSATRMRPDHRA